MATIFSAAGVGLWAVWSASVWWGLGYLAVCLATLPSISYAYCAKCPCRDGGCPHVLPGLVARILPRRLGPYRWPDYAGVALPLSILAGLPQFWLIQRPWILGLFWVLLGWGILEIALCVCPRCLNRACPLCRNQGGA